MTSRLRIVHTSHFTYAKPVQASFNEARLTPMATPWQIPLESHLRVPQASWHYRYFDYWATQVSVFEAHDVHGELLVEATSLVEIDDARRPATQPSVAWSDIRADAIHQEMGDYLTQTPASTPPDEVQAIADESAAGRSPHETGLEIVARLDTEMTYEPGWTGARSPAEQAWAARRGVCQDYAHLLIGALRHVGIPARYVSGYLHPHAEADLGETFTGESHAWVEWWMGQWTGIDPANGVLPDERYVIVGRGRDYADVPPIKGIVAGASAAAKLDVSVEVTRLA